MFILLNEKIYYINNNKSTTNSGTCCNYTLLTRVTYTEA